ncbi:glycosyltransferase [Butyrivibrio sp. WCD3002]|uniref:glycosyltransferase n=1 Tax=Butyrivibrio sp. WCD3002 TaxID=1280676 RepID=UPI000401496C|nr:glycosyltransferase [Butyrivibrio sp. WCD3002]
MNGNKIYKIGLLSHTGSLGGAERMLYYMAQLLKKTDCFEPIMIIPTAEGRPLEQLCGEEIEYKSIETLPGYICLNEDVENSFSSLTVRIKNDIYDIIQECDIDVLISNTQVSLCGVMAAYEAGIPTIAWAHGIFDPFLLGNEYDSRMRLMFDRVVYELCNNVIFCSSWTKEYYANFLDGNRGVVINNWSLPSSNELTNGGDNTFICLNSFEKNKGIIDLLKAAKIVKDKGYNFEIHLYGKNESDYEKEIEQFIKKNDLQDNVVLKNKTKNIAKAYTSATCLVQPSYLESFGLTIIEAMSYGVVPVSYKSGGPDNIICDGVDGFLIDRGDYTDLANKMIFVLKNPAKIKEMSANARDAFVSKYSENAAKDQIVDLLHETLKNPGNDTSQKEFVYDLIMLYLLKGQGKTGTNSVQAVDSSCIGVSERLSKPLSYDVTFKTNRVSRMYVIFTSYANDVSDGNMTISLYDGENKLAESKLNLNKIINNQWSEFEFDTVAVQKGKKYRVELLCESDDASSYVVYEKYPKNAILRIAVSNSRKVFGRKDSLLYYAE